MKNNIRVFFVVDSVEDNEELFETLQKARKYAVDEIDPKDKPRIYIAIVRNAYREGKEWNYADRADTFEIVKII